MSIHSVMAELYKEPRIISQVGEVVVPVTPGYGLRSGGSAYEFAIIVSVEPLVGVSEETDMRWGSTIDLENFKAIGMARPEHIDQCKRRL